MKRLVKLVISSDRRARLNATPLLGAVALCMAALPLGCVVKAGLDKDAEGAGGTSNGAASDGGDARGGVTSEGSAGSTGGGEGGTEPGAATGGSGGGSAGGAPAAGAGGAGASSGAGAAIRWLDCGGRDVSSAAVVSSDVAGEQRWSGTVFVKGMVNVRGHLTIAPGTNVIVDANGGLDFSWTSSMTTLTAEGTAEQPIRFCGAREQAGYWRSLIFEGGVSSDSVLRNALIADAGAADAALVVVAPIRIEDVQVRSSGADGARIANLGQESRALSVQGSAGSALVLTTELAINRLPLGGSFVDNQENVARIRLDSYRDALEFHALGIPYLQEKSVEVSAPHLTFDAGVEYRFAIDTSLELGWNANATTLSVNGTEAAPVLFRGAESRPGYWSSILVDRSVAPDSVISHAKISDGGSLDKFAVSVAAPIQLEDVVLEDNENGLFVARYGLQPTSRNLTITKTSKSPPLTVDPDALITLPTGGSFSGNGSDVISLRAGDYHGRGTVPKFDVPYRVDGAVRTMKDSVLKLTPGTTFLMTAEGSFEISWNAQPTTFIAVGTEREPIVFRGATERAGFWSGLYINGATTSDSALEYVEIGHGGLDAENRADLILGRALSIKNCRFYESSGYGILKRASDETDYTLMNEFQAVELGSVGQP